MSDCDLTKLSPNSFERLVRALAFAEMGPGGTVFSSGPDGGRDFIFEGAIRGFEARGWKGYLIIQAKFRETLEGGQRDIDWLRKQIDGELKKLTDEQRNLRKPEYYILATNVRLSGATGRSRNKSKKTGGVAKVSSFFELWKTEIGLCDFHLWPADLIIDLLTRHPEVRQTYAAWVTAGDVLSAMLAQLKPRQKDFSTLIRRAIKRKISADQYVPLNEAGSVDHKKIPTSKVFIDLPVSGGGLEKVANASGGDPPSFVASLIKLCKAKLNPEFLPGFTSEGQIPRSLQSRVVLLGGPGQGKSTTGLFAVQLFRAAILQEDVALNEDPNIKDVVPDILHRAEKEGLSTDLPRRFPVHISLPTYADRFSACKRESSEAPSLLSHIAHELGRAADGVIDREDLRVWLRAYPWLVVLDGLDEVPPSGERAAVIEAINAFVTEVVESRGDLLLLVTSRPQGYNRDLDERHWAHWSLADLPNNRALAYADALSDAQHPHDNDRQAKIRTGLERAMKQPATARLMVSPLQVTIMHLIVDGGGSAPVGRWALFNEYFQVLKKREKAKGGETREILEKNWDHLDPVHHRAGLILQTESEMSGAAGAHFTRPRLIALIDGYLTSCGYDSRGRAACSSELTRLALHRLVLLSTRQQGRTEDEGLISFDVRSLQEFMAAAELTTESDSKSDSSDKPLLPTIEDRLTAIARMAHWRHVFLIAASRCFSDTALHHLRSAAVAIPRALDIADPDRLTRTGARLALDMLADGIGNTHPVSRCKLAEHAMELLELGPEQFDPRLLSIWSPETAVILEEKLHARLKEGTSPAALAAWRMVLQMNAPAERLLHAADMFWPTSPEDGLRVLSAVGLNMPSTRLESKAIQSVTQSRPSDVANLLWRTVHDEPVEVNSRQDEEYLKQLSYVVVGRRNERYGLNVSVLGSRDTGLTALYRGVTEIQHLLITDQPHTWNSGWKVLRAALEFGRSPSARALASSLGQINTPNLLQEAKNFFGLFPWPIETLVVAAENTTQLQAAADKAKAGEFGDKRDWEQAERRWESSGISSDDLLASGGEWPLGPGIGRVGAPVLMSMSGSQSAELPNVISHLMEIRKNMHAGIARNRLTDAVIFCLAVTNKINEFPPKSLIDVLLAGSNRGFHYMDCLRWLPPEIWADESDVRKISDIIRRARFFFRQDTEHFESLNDLMIAAFNRTQFARPMLYAICCGIFNQEEKNAEYITRLSPLAFEWVDTDAPNIRSAVAILRFVRHGEMTPKLLAALTEGDEEYAGLSLVTKFCKSKIGSLEKREALAAAVFRRLEPAVPPEASRLRSELKKLLDARKSGLSERAVWMDRLRLPSDAFRVMEQRSNA